MKIRDFVEKELEQLRKECNFTDAERRYFDLRAKDKSNIEISIEMNISEAQVSKLAKRVKSKIIRVL